MESPISPLAVATNQNAGSLTTSLETKTKMTVRMKKVSLNFKTKTKKTYLLTHVLHNPTRQIGIS
jgi:hypothetical protein